MRRVIRRVIAAWVVVLSLAGCGSSATSHSAAARSSPAAVATTAAASPSATPTKPAGSPSPSAAAQGCRMLPADNVWHADVSRLPVHGSSAAYVASMGSGAHVHADFGGGLIDG